MSLPVPTRALPGWLLGRAAVPLRLLTPLGRGVLALGVVLTGLAVWLNWQEFTQLGVVALGLVVLGLAWQVLPASPTARVVVRPNRIAEGGTNVG